jgi:xanthine dehydrogenase/oxidase
MGTECCRVKKDNPDKSGKPAEESGKKEDENGKKTEPAVQSDAFAEPIFPPALMKYPILPLRLVGDKATWYRPLTLASLLQLKAEHPHAKLVVGNTEIGIEMKFKHAHYPVIISPTHVPELCGIVEGESGVEVGASVTINDLRVALEVFLSCKVRGSRGKDGDEPDFSICYLFLRRKS